MGDERGGSLVLGILRDVADLIAGLDRALAEEARQAKLGMASAKVPGFFKSQSPQVSIRPHLAA